MNPFIYHKPTSIHEAEGLLTEDAKLLAGGMTLLPTIKQGLATPSSLIDLSAFPELNQINKEENGLIIGSMVTHAQVAQSDLVRQSIPSLSTLANNIGDPQVRNRGTIGGSVANNDPAADYPAALLALGANIHTNHRKVNADDFFTGLFSTVLEDNEIIQNIEFSSIPKQACYIKFQQPASLYALVGVFVAKHNDGHIRVTITGAGEDGVFRCNEIEEALSNEFSIAALEKVEVSSSNLISDLHGSSEYRASLIKVLSKQALQLISC